MSNTVAPTPLNASQIAMLIPHHGDMCLLSEVLHYDVISIHCRADTHYLPNNPLRENGILRTVCGVEYAAQAMAVHGALLATQRSNHPRSGRLASVRSAEFFASRLDDIHDDLHIYATQLMGDEHSMIYEFSVTAQTKLLLRGKATVVLVS